MIKPDSLYKLYSAEFPTIIKSNGDINSYITRCSKEKFLTLASKASSSILPISKGKKVCKKVLVKEMTSGMGIIEYFLLKAIISWIVEKILSYYFL